MTYQPPLPALHVLCDRYSIYPIYKFVSQTLQASPSWKNASSSRGRLSKSLLRASPALEALLKSFPIIRTFSRQAWLSIVSPLCDFTVRSEPPKSSWSLLGWRPLASSKPHLATRLAGTYFHCLAKIPPYYSPFPLCLLSSHLASTSLLHYLYKNYIFFSFFCLFFSKLA